MSDNAGFNLDEAIAAYVQSQASDHMVDSYVLVLATKSLAMIDDPELESNAVAITIVTNDSQSAPTTFGLVDIAQMKLRQEFFEN